MVVDYIVPLAGSMVSDLTIIPLYLSQIYITQVTLIISAFLLLYYNTVLAVFLQTLLGPKLIY